MSPMAYYRPRASRLSTFSPHKEGVTAPGDDAGESMGDGPHQSEIDANLYGSWD